MSEEKTMGAEVAKPFASITVHFILDDDRDEKGEPVQFVSAIEVVGIDPDGKSIGLSYEDEPSAAVVGFWRWLAAAHGWALDES